jgi:acetolactate synthase I/II/III large subunit
MAELTGGQALVQSLKREGVKVIFALPGVQLDWAFDALYAEKENIRIIHTRHEQATAYMADGYARTTGEVGVCLVVPGPGLLNATAALSTAYACSAPVLCLSGQIQSDLIGVGRGMLHEIPYQQQMLKSVTKWSACGMTPEEIPGLVREAFQQMRTGRPRPVEIEVPPDILAKPGEVELFAPEKVDRERPAGDADAIARAAKLLGEAKNPLIVSGGGVLGSGAWNELRAVAEMLQAPVVMSRNGRGALSDREYLAQTSLGGRELLPKADVILAVGTRFVEPATQWGLAPEQVTIHMDIDEEEVGRNMEPTVRIIADAKVGLAALAEQIGKYNTKRPSREKELNDLKAGLEKKMAEVQPQADFAKALRAAMPDDAILINESTQVGYFSNFGFPVYHPRTFITSGYQGTLGYGYATALGAQVGNPGKKVVSINGDGGFMYNVQELSTQVKHNIPLVTVVFNDNAFGNVKRIQQQTFDGRTIASDLKNPDFVKLAESFDMVGLRANGPKELEKTLDKALAMNAPVLIEAPVEQMPSPWSLMWGRQQPPSVIGPRR